MQTQSTTKASSVNPRGIIIAAVIRATIISHVLGQLSYHKRITLFGIRILVILIALLLVVDTHATEITFLKYSSLSQQCEGNTTLAIFIEHSDILWRLGGATLNPMGVLNTVVVATGKAMEKLLQYSYTDRPELDKAMKKAQLWQDVVPIVIQILLLTGHQDAVAELENNGAFKRQIEFNPIPAPHHLQKNDGHTSSADNVCSLTDDNIS